MAAYSSKQFIWVSFYLVSLTLYAQERTSPTSQNEELGKVSWYRDYQTALQLSKEQNNPILILFQEVPGCSTCRNYGKNVLSHPLMVEAIENLFIPLAIFNNKGGKDKQVLQRYNEPSWNNPVVRIVNQYGANIVNRISGDYSNLTLYKAMVKTLKSENTPIPEYLDLLGLELTSEQQGVIKEKYFQMYCFWSGEKHFGAKEGILSTEAGFINGREVVKVKYDETQVSERQLTAFAKSARCTPINEQNDYRLAKNDVKYYLRHTNYKYLPLTELQKIKVNSAIGNGQSAERYLSPKQLTWLTQINQNYVKSKILYDNDFSIAWNMMANN